MISVLMAINKYDSFTEKAIDSILNQSFIDFELIIISNGKFRDDIESAILSLDRMDPRIKIFKSQIGQLAYALNVGIDNASYDYIARMDADDISWPDRLRKQFDYLQENQLDMVGSSVRLIDENDNISGVRKMKREKEINRFLSYGNAFVHPSVLAKKSIFLEARGYNAGFNSEDYDLWLRLRRLDIKWDNMDEVLLDYRIHSGASQRRLLGYAESAGYAMREFILHKSASNFFAVFYHCVKSIVRAKKY